MTVMKQQPVSTTTVASTTMPSGDPASDTDSEGLPFYHYLLVGMLSVIFVFAVLLLIAMLKRDMKRRKRGKPRML
jgi:hypothetical protein